MWVVMTSSAHMPSSCRGRYRNVALVLLSQYATARDIRPRIDERDKDIVRIAYKNHHSVGKTERCGYAVALKAAEAEAQRRNSLPTEVDYSSWGGSA